ncbi:hypothetical protein BD309DRAFT_822783, partial [Dichomitus squalens]
MATTHNRHTLCTCPTCIQLDPIGQWIPTTTALHHDLMARRVASQAYQRGRGRGTATGSRARGATLRGTRNPLRGGRGALPARSGADSHNSRGQASVPMKRARAQSPLNTPPTDEALDPSTNPFDELGPIDVDCSMDGVVSQVDVEGSQDMTTNLPHSADSDSPADDAQTRPPTSCIPAQISDERAQLD